MYLPRSAGLLLHLTSLPGDYGVGDFGESAFKFVDFLSEAGITTWQVLPLGPTSHGNSPYSCYSAFAGNPLLISPAKMLQDGFLSRGDLPAGDDNGAASVDYPRAVGIRLPLLQRAYERFTSQSQCEQLEDFESFASLQKWWLDDFALFAALKDRYQTLDWSTWDSELLHRDAAALASCRQQLAREIEYEKFVQFLFFSQWQNLVAYANAKGIKIFGDMPIFVAHGSADVWANQSLCALDRDGRPTHVAGVPPDYFSKTGQLWGNPVYRWDKLAENKYAWWVRRFQAAFETYDLLRIDHFRGFEAYWEVPATARTAVSGRWVKGPGEHLFRTVARELGDLPIVAEDLGLITDEVHQLRDRFGFPGMRVLQFGFDQTHDNYHRPESFPENSVAYTGTHDNETIMGWYAGRAAHPQRQKVLSNYVSGNERSVHQQLLRMVFESASNLVIIPLQDILGLGNEARMNVPGQADGNWVWRCTPAEMSRPVVEQISQLVEESHREAKLHAM